MELVIATKNKKKIEEIKRITSDLNIKILTYDDFPEFPDVVEDGATFRENAAKKSLAIAKFTGKPVLSDDSGLEVYALGGAPGIFSARFAGESANDSENVKKLLEIMKHLKNKDRRARFVCCIALAMPDLKTYFFEGTVEGRIIKEPRGQNGFGYDPVFVPIGSRRTFAEMSDKEKDSISHRGRALLKLRKFLKSRIIKQIRN